MVHGEALGELASGLLDTTRLPGAAWSCSVAVPLHRRLRSCSQKAMRPF